MTDFQIGQLDLRHFDEGAHLAGAWGVLKGLMSRSRTRQGNGDTYIGHYNKRQQEGKNGKAYTDERPE